MKTFRKKNRGDIKENMAHVKMTPEGCKIVKGSFNKKTGECEIRQYVNPDTPDEVTHREFDVVTRPEERNAIKSDDSE